MTPEDLATIHAEAFPERPWSAAEFARLLEQPTSVLVTSETAQGFALAQFVAGEAELLTIAVASKARRQGHGAALMASLLTELDKQGGTRLFLEVASDNAPARALYERAGFAQVGLRKGYYARAGQLPADALVLSREIIA